MVLIKQDLYLSTCSIIEIILIHIIKHLVKYKASTINLRLFS